jgi:small subunit ribosomal protein S7
MSPRTSIWGACRALAIRSRPLAPRPAPFVNALPRNRWYSNDGNDQPPKAIDNAQKAQDSQAGSVSKEGDAPAASTGNGDAEVGIGLSKSSHVSQLMGLPSR